jgi:hypothetical protein
VLRLELERHVLDSRDERGGLLLVLARLAFDRLAKLIENFPQALAKLGGQRLAFLDLALEGVEQLR